MGQTGRSFTKRYNEHLKAVTIKSCAASIPKNSNFATHIPGTGHLHRTIQEGLEVLYNVTNSKGYTGEKSLKLTSLRKNNRSSY